MLDLADVRWGTLSHAMGSATDVPDKLSELARQPGDAAILDWMWTSLTHQGDVSTAAYAALPHLVVITERAPQEDKACLVALAGYIVSKVRGGRDVPKMPADLEPAFASSVRRLQGIASALVVTEIDAAYALAVVATVAATTGFPEVALAIFDGDFNVPCSKCGAEVDFVEARR